MKKNLLSILICLAMLVGLFAGCGSKATNQQTSSQNNGSTEQSTSKKYKVFLITMDQMDQHWVNVDKGCQKAVAELGNIDYKWLAPDVKDDAKQIECINNAVAGGANAILLAANGPVAVKSALEQAQQAGVKIIYVDSPADFPSIATFATDNKAAGTTAGKEMLKALEGAGIKEGKIGIVNVNAATASTVAREAGFREAFKGSKFEILETQYGEGDAAKSKDIAANYITQGCVGIFGANEGSTVGTGNAIKEAGKKVIGVGFDKSDAILNLIKDGYILCTMAQNPDVMGYEGMKAAAQALSGQYSGPTNVDTGVSVIDKSKLQ
ncbi:monosaccharide ABC transporter substrate-binding protein, CUT2 family [Caloramator quimbayensis]|uniref:Monosaccharide ABC transporter substrate-binding protein, CUT2 family n=1 Tax=Caloramator quimbayensis TaxID=1147123 RepID=A0A1T4Y8Q0_9CLOT|nr:ABC transporter substrate-binding protein [Caloramator quimbayensis]SKA98116.1 monosaccharide ABC transporter substrate-binding protein, CUT2 family [Caloramator quimbayensis]